MIKKYENIVLWRVIACLGVFITHLGTRMNLEGSMRVITDFGEYGVLFFFIITGFLACDSKLIVDDKISYWKKRIIRILPLYLAVMFFYFVAFSFSEKSIVRGWEMLTEGNNVGGTWSVYVFLLFYLLIPYLFKLFNTYGKVWFLFLGLYLIRYVFRTYALGGQWQTMTSFCFCIEGMIIWYSYKEQKEDKTIFLVVLIIGLHLIQGASDNHFLYSLLFILLFMSTKAMHIENTVIKRILGGLDRYSYDIYLVQGIMFYLFIDGRNLSKIAILIISLVGMTFLVLIAQFGIECPVQKLVGHNNIGR